MVCIIVTHYRCHDQFNGIFQAVSQLLVNNVHSISEKGDFVGEDGRGSNRKKMLNVF